MSIVFGAGSGRGADERRRIEETGMTDAERRIDRILTPACRELNEARNACAADPGPENEARYRRALAAKQQAERRAFDRA